ncbi:MAG TPA: hypothetical protein VIN39_05465 [Candidatus Dormibacteraeota bacterium]
MTERMRLDGRDQGIVPMAPAIVGVLELNLEEEALALEPHQRTTPRGSQTRRDAVLAP